MFILFQSFQEYKTLLLTLEQMKILNFCLIYNKIKHKVNLELGLYVIFKMKKGGISSNIINYNHGISWEYNSPEKDLKEVSLIENEKKIIGYPSPDMKYMVVLFHRNSKFYLHPNNLVVFYPNGEIKQVIKVPELVSDKAIKNAQNPFGEHKEGGFENIRWHKKIIKK